MHRTIDFGSEHFGVCEIIIKYIVKFCMFLKSSISCSFVRILICRNVGFPYCYKYIIFFIKMHIKIVLILECKFRSCSVTYYIDVPHLPVSISSDGFGEMGSFKK
ncbi:hypothetical protein VNO78_07378 [Psophocarpus tetragonolobus]|uniref:Uncharacterized protein n=1 Tax=Psophocarpus tetragonolobus TaxID=3891 RepID=A0AAN9SSZ5_PSOTE